MWHDLNHWLVERGVSPFSIDVVLKSSLLFVTVAIACALLYRQSAALRHRLWCLGFVGSLAIVPCLLLMPTVAVPVLAPSETPRLSIPDSRLRTSRIDIATEQPALPQIPSMATDEVAVPAPANPATAGSPGTSAVVAAVPFRVSWALIVWVTGVSATMLPLILGWIATSRLIKGARRIEPAQSDWMELLQQSAAQLSLKPCVALYQTRLALVPMTWGIFRPIMMLPAGSDQWTRSRKQIVLLHELAHIRRSDLLLQLIARIACSVHWFNPLAWYALRRLRVEREQACDDCVVAAGQRPSDYASELVDIAEFHQVPRLTLSVGMANSSHLEGRLNALFDRARSHLPLTRRGARWLWVSALLLVTAVVVIHPVERMVRAEENEGETQAGSRETSNEIPIGPQPDGTWNVQTTGNFQVIVLLPDGRPASGAKLFTSIVTDDQEFKDRYKSSSSYECDAAGQCDVPLPRSLSLIRIWVQAGSCVPLFSQWWPGKQEDGHLIPESYTYQLQSGVGVSGIVTDEEDRPVAGVKVEVDLEEQPGEITRVHPIGSWHAIGSIVTDEAGRWSASTVPEGANVSVVVRLTHPEFSDRTYSVRSRSVSLTDLRSGTARMSLKRGTVISGQVTDANGTPVPDAVVVCGDDAYFQLGNTIDTSTDADGRYAFRPQPDGEYNVTVIAKGWMPQLRAVHAKAGMPSVDFSVPAGKELRIRFVDAAGKPVPKAWASIDRWKGIASIANQSANNTNQRIPLKANDDGVYVWDWAPDGDISFAFMAEGFAEQQGTLQADGTDHTVVLRPVLMAAGNVTDSVTGQAVNEFNVMPILYFRPDDPVLDDLSPASGRSGRFRVQFHRSDVDHGLRIERVGYQTQEFGPWKIGDPNPELEVKLVAEEPFGTTVVDPDGNPVPGAEIFIAAGSQDLDIHGHKFGNARRMAVTDSEGRFAIPRPIADFLLVVVADAGYAEIAGPAAIELSTIRLLHWASADGHVMQAGQPIAGQRVRLSPIRPNLTGLPRVGDSFSTETDDAGRFSFPRVPPVKCQVAPWLDIRNETQIQSAQSTPLELQPGQHVTLNLNGTGCEVTGRVMLKGRDDVDLHYSLNYLIARQGAIAPPRWLAQQNFDHSNGWLERWDSLPASESFRATLPHHHVKLDASGHFTIHGVAPGEYDMHLKLYENPAGGCLVEAVGVEVFPVTVPDESGTLDIGVISVDAMQVLRPGDLVPDVTFRTLDGATAKLSDFRGRKVLIDCWATWCAPCLAALPEIRTLAETRKDGLMVLGLSFDKDSGTARRYIENNRMPWTHGFVDDTATLAETLGIATVPTYLLIDAEGRLISKSGKLHLDDASSD